VILIDPCARPVIAHRGGRAAAPENTLVAFERALAAGADAFELDVQVTADGHAVVCHDARVDRTTDACGVIGKMRLADLRNVNAGSRWCQHHDPERANAGVPGAARPFAHGGHRIPTLAQVLDAFSSVAVIIELKSVAVAAAATSAIKRCGAEKRVLIGAFDDAALATPRSAGLMTVASRQELIRLFPAALLRGTRAALAAFAAIAMPPTRYGLPLPLRGYMKASRRPLHVWTVNDPHAARRYWRFGANGIITDDPAAIVHIRSGEPA
jgi:glycerophosphoryl diester phosphodiesterase